MGDLSALESWAGALMANMAPAARRAAATDIGRALRRNQAERIKKQQDPAGAPFEARKPRQGRNGKLKDKKGRIKRQAMFAKLRTTAYLKVTSEADGVGVGFLGRTARLARVHQEGGSSLVAKGGPMYKYPVRQLLGFTQADRDMIRDKLLEHLSK
jgi:phage virion morphogenesis protein